MDTDRSKKCFWLWPPYRPGVVMEFPRELGNKGGVFKWKAELNAPFNNLKAWTDTMYGIDFSSLNVNTRPIFHEIEDDDESSCFPIRMFRESIRYFDCKSSSAHKCTGDIGIDTISNLVERNQFWKRVCLTEIPSKYLLEIFGKRHNGQLNVDLIAESEYKLMYKQWRMWQMSKMFVSDTGRLDYISSYGVSKVLCRQDEVLLVSARAKWTYSLSVCKGKLVLTQKKCEPHKLSCLMVVNPKTLCAASLYCSDDKKFVEFNVRSDADFSMECESSSTSKYMPVGRYTGQLLAVDSNERESKCCMVREIWFGLLSRSGSKVIYEHYCLSMKATKFVSVVHQLIVGLLPSNSIVIHNMSQNLCIKISKWLPEKYVEATAVYVYTNLLIVGSLNSHLLVYRLRDWKDFRRLNPKNLVLVSHLDIGPITSLDVADYGKCAAIFAASPSSLTWLNISLKI